MREMWEGCENGAESNFWLTSDKETSTYKCLHPIIIGNWIPPVTEMTLEAASNPELSDKYPTLRTQLENPIHPTLDFWHVEV